MYSLRYKGVRVGDSEWRRLGPDGGLIGWEVGRDLKMRTYDKMVGGREILNDGGGYGHIVGGKTE